MSYELAMIASATVSARSTDYESEEELEAEQINNNNEYEQIIQDQPLCLDELAEDLESKSDQTDASSCSSSDQSLDDQEVAQGEATSYPILTPTPPSPNEPVNEGLNSVRFQERLDGPAVIATIDYNPEAEYLSDPDLHDERPPRACSSSYTSDPKLDKHLESHDSDVSCPTEIPLRVKSTEDPHATTTTTTTVEDHQLVSETISNIPQITASDARAESFVDESTLADELDSLRSEAEKIGEDSSADETTVDTSDTVTPSIDVQPTDPVGNLKLESEIEDQKNCVTATQDNDDNQVSGDGNNFIQTLKDYCDKLADLIRIEAFKQLEELAQVSASADLSSKLALRYRVGFQQMLEVDQASSSSMDARERKIYTSSMYYNDQLDSFPTIEQQVERSRMIAKQLGDEISIDQACSAGDTQQIGQPDARLSEQARLKGGLDSTSNSRHASAMFKRRRERMDKYTLVNRRSLEEEAFQEPEMTRGRRASAEPAVKSWTHAIESRAKLATVNGRRQSDITPSSLVMSSDTEDRGTMTDTEYEAPKVRRRALPARATTTPFRERSSRHVEVENRSGISSKFRPFLDASTLKDIERLKSWSPHVEFNQHDSVSPELCLKLVQDLEGKEASRSSSRGAILFGQRQLSSADWIVESKEDESETRPSRAQSPIKSTCIVTTEGETSPLAELQVAPVLHVTHQAQAQLETATITRMPSFSSSSRRVIECDSPDLLTSRDDEDIDADGEENLPVGGDPETAERQAGVEEELDCLEPKVHQASFSQLHESTVLDWQRPRVETPIWQVSSESALPAAKAPPDTCWVPLAQESSGCRRMLRSASVAPEMCPPDSGFARAPSSLRTDQRWQPVISGKFWPARWLLNSGAC